jgi:glycerate-2-kinase
VSTAERELLRELFATGVAAVDPERAVGTALAEPGASAASERCVAIAAGKAAHAMARGWHARAGAPRVGLIVAREPGLAPPGWQARVGAHPLPTLASAEAGAHALEVAARATPDETLVVLLSGGASALLTAPLAGLALEELRSVTDLLLRSGAEIGELNCVRKHLNAVSGGRLAAASPAREIVVLALSDVLGDDLATIGSGPCAADPTTFGDAIAILERRRVWDAAPLAVREHLVRGARGALAESLKPGDPRLARVHARVIASNATALAAVIAAGRDRGLDVVVASDALRGEARTLGHQLARRALALRGARDALLVAGGEPSVVVRGAGRGGRCQELALAAALALAGEQGVTLLAAGTDGSDGPTDAAGAFADGASVARGAAAGAEAENALRDNDAHGFFAREGGLLRTGPTGTNALDLVLVAISARP